MLHPICSALFSSLRSLFLCILLSAQSCVYLSPVRSNWKYFRMLNCVCGFSFWTIMWIFCCLNYYCIRPVLHFLPNRKRSAWTVELRFTIIKRRYKAKLKKISQHQIVGHVMLETVIHLKHCHIDVRILCILWYIRVCAFAVRNCTKLRYECIQHTLSLSPSPYSNELADLSLRANTIQLFNIGCAIFYFIYHSFAFHLTRAKAENAHFVERVYPLDRWW